MQRHHARYLVRVYSGRTVLHSVRLSSYRRACTYAASFVHYPATVRPVLTEREAMLCCALVCALIAFAFARALGA